MVCHWTLNASREKLQRFRICLLLLVACFRRTTQRPPEGEIWWLSDINSLILSAGIISDEVRRRFRPCCPLCDLSRRLPAKSLHVRCSLESEWKFQTAEHQTAAISRQIWIFLRIVCDFTVFSFCVKCRIFMITQFILFIIKKLYVLTPRRIAKQRIDYSSQRW